MREARPSAPSGASAEQPGNVLGVGAGAPDRAASAASPLIADTGRAGAARRRPGRVARGRLSHKSEEDAAPVHPQQDEPEDREGGRGRSAPARTSARARRTAPCRGGCAARPSCSGRRRGRSRTSRSSSCRRPGTGTRPRVQPRRSIAAYQPARNSAAQPALKIAHDGVQMRLTSGQTPSDVQHEAEHDAGGAPRGQPPRRRRHARRRAAAARRPAGRRSSWPATARSSASGSRRR